jgi:curved DNA-binding protein CbpA
LGKEQFEKVLIAYEVLIDSNRRKQYDLKIKYGSAGSTSYSSSSAKAAQVKKQWSFTEEELKRRQYYQENYKSHFEKNQKQNHPPLKKSYNEYKYILFATPLAVALLLFIITIYDKDKKPSKKIVQKTEAVNEKRELKNSDSPYASYFSRPVYDTVGNLNVLVNNLSPNEVVLVLEDQDGKFLRSTYMKPDYFVEIGELPKEEIVVKMMLGNNWEQLQEHKNAEVLGGFEKSGGYYRAVAGKENRWTITIDRKGFAGFEKINEKEFFKKSN